MNNCGVYEDGTLMQTYSISKVGNSTYGMTFANGLTGRIDEFRIQDGVQSAAYVSADYATQTDPEFLTYGRPRSTAPTMLILR